MDASPPPSRAPSGAGHLVGGRYRLEHRIAGGGMATVWEAVDEVLTRRVAVKLLHPHLAADDQFVARFKREAVAAAGLTHPSVVSIYDTCRDGDTEAIVMELVRGTTLRAELDRRKRFDPPDAVSVVAEVADALSAAHQAGIVHRDVKPANVLLSNDGRVLVADFGIAKAVDGLELTDVGMTLGTAKYLAPEQVEGKPVDGRADVYAAGVILYELLCGQPPFAASTEAATALARLRHDPTPPRTLVPDLPAELEAITLRALARDPDQRFSTAAELRDALRTWARNGSVALPRLTPSDPPATPSRQPVIAGAPGAPAVAPAGDATTVSVSDATQAVPRPEAPSATPPASPDVSRTKGRARRPDPTSPAQPSRRQRRWGLGLTMGLVAVSAVVAAVLVLQTRDPGGVDDPFRRDDPISGAGPVVVGATTFDPPPGDGRERDGEVGAVFDADPATVWRSECYSNPSFGNLKPGVGVVLQLDEVTDVVAVGVDSPLGGWSAEVRVAEQAGATLDDWGAAVGTVGDAAAGETTIELTSTAGSFVLVFFTGLPPEANPECAAGNPFAVTVSTVVVGQD